MAVNGKAYAHGSATHAARVLRGFVAATFGLPTISHANAIAPTTRGGGYGVIGEGDLLVTTTGGLGYSVAAGRVVATGTFALAQGAYTGYNDAAVTGNLTAHSAFVRHDLICYRVRDTDEDASGSEDDLFHVVQGIAASTDPAIPSSLGSLVVLSRAVLPATSGTVTYTDLRTFATAIGGTHRCTSASRPTGAALYKALAIHELDTGARLWWDGSTWRYEYKPIAAFTPTANFTLGNALIQSDYAIADNICTYNGRVTLGTTSAFPGGTFTPQFSAPFASAAAGRRNGFAAFYDGSADQAYPAWADFVGGGGTLAIHNVGGATGISSISTTSPFAWASAGQDEINWSITYPVA